MTGGPHRAGVEANLSRVWATRGLWARVLWPLSLIFAAGLGMRRLAYRRGWWHSMASAVPVIVVGNRIVGGGGKTPTVLAIVMHLRGQGWRPGIVSRGHGRRAERASAEPSLIVGVQTTADEAGDEPLLLARRAKVPVIVGRDRVAAARTLLRAHPDIDCLIGDDGLQHLRWARDIEIVVFDRRGSGNGWLLPAGPLREPITVPPRASSVIHLYTDGMSSAPLPGYVAHRRLAGLVELAAWWGGAPADPDALAALRLNPGRVVHACAGIAQPDRFFAMLAEAGLVCDTIALPDHADFAVLPWPASTPHVVVTEKDAIKLQPGRLATERPGTTVWVAPLDFEPEAGFWTALDDALGALPSAPRAALAPDTQG